MASPLDNVAGQIEKAFRKVFYDATLKRQLPPTGPAYDPTPGDIVSYPCKALAVEYTASLASMGQVESNDVRVLILAKTLAVTPHPMDYVVINKQNVSGAINAGSGGMKPVQIDPAQAVWDCRVSR